MADVQFPTLAIVEEKFFKQMANNLRDRFRQWKDFVIGYEDNYVEVVKVSKTPNATSLTTCNGNYSNGASLTDVVTIEGASSIQVTLAYQSEANCDWVQVAPGETGASSSNTRYSGSSLQQTVLTFENTDTVNFYFRSDGSNSSFLGYYAEVRGLDENGEIIKANEPIPIYETRPMEKYTTDEMLEAVKELYPKSVSVGGAVVYVIPPVAIEGTPIDINNGSPVEVGGAVVTKYTTVNIPTSNIAVENTATVIINNSTVSIVEE